MPKKTGDLGASALKTDTSACHAHEDGPGASSPGVETSRPDAKGGAVMDAAPLTSAYGFGWRLAFALVVVGCLAHVSLLLDDWTRPDLLLVGLVTDDVVNGQVMPGGAISYAATVAAAHGVRAHVVTMARPGTNLSILEGHQVHLVPSDQTLTFEHTYTWWGNKRKLRVPARPNTTLALAHVPARWRRPKTLLLGTLLLGEMDVPGLLAMPAARVGLIAQGLQRDLDASSRVVHLSQPSPALLAALDPRVTLFLSDVEADPWPKGTLEGLLPKVHRIVVTRGEEGAHVLVANRSALHVPPAPVTAVDTNGAGDVFATAFMLSSGNLARGERDQRHGVVSAWRRGLGGKVITALRTFLAGLSRGKNMLTGKIQTKGTGQGSGERRESGDGVAGGEGSGLMDDELAGQAAAVAASFVVSQPQACKPFCSMDGYRPSRWDCHERKSSRDGDKGAGGEREGREEGRGDAKGEGRQEGGGGFEEERTDLTGLLEAYCRLWTLGTRWVRDATFGLVGGVIWPESK